MNKIKTKIPAWLIISFVIIGFAGFLDATYLTVAHYSGSELNCEILKGCNEVTRSKYSQIFGIPLALMGSLYYFSVLFLNLLFFDTKKNGILSLITPLTILGFLSTLVLIYLQIFVIEAICIYCMFSALTSTILFVLGLMLWRYKKRITSSS